jgi:uncharacterized integral membrane protein (TIGR00697 family)
MIEFIILLQQLSPLSMFVLQFLLSISMIFILMKFFGKDGLYLYVIVGIIASNIQVLKAVKLPYFDSPVPLGDVMFTSLFLVGDIITEYYGRQAAQKSIWLGFASSAMFAAIMILAVGIKPLYYSDTSDILFIKSHHAMSLLFTPSVSILSASLIAYFVSLWFDVRLFSLIKTITRGKWLWLRSIVSSSLGIIIDTCIFSAFAWVIFATNPLPLESVIDSYMINAIKIRLFLTILNVPVFYFIKKTIRVKS